MALWIGYGRGCGNWLCWGGSLWLYIEEKYNEGYCKRYYRLLSTKFYRSVPMFVFHGHPLKPPELGFSLAAYLQAATFTPVTTFLCHRALIPWDNSAEKQVYLRPWQGCPKHLSIEHKYKHISVWVQPKKRKVTLRLLTSVGTGDASTMCTVMCRVNGTGKLNAVCVQHRQGRKELGRLITSFLGGKHDD